MEKTNRSKVSTFFFVLIILFIPSTVLYVLTRELVFWNYVFALFYMSAPGFAAIITQRFIYKDKLRELGFQKLKISSFILFPFLSTFIIFNALLLGSFIFGNVLHIPGFGYITTDIFVIIKNFVGDVAFSEGTSLPSFFVLMPGVFIASVVSGFTFNMIFSLSEELAWRGFLLNELKSLGFLKANLIIGTIWGFWHTPIILMGYNYPTSPFLGIFAMCLLTIPLGFILSIARIKANNVMASAVVHGIFNGYAGMLLAVLVGANVFIGTVLGLFGSLILSTIAFLLYLINKKEITKWMHQSDVHNPKEV